MLIQGIKVRSHQQNSVRVLKAGCVPAQRPLSEGKGRIAPVWRVPVYVLAVPWWGMQARLSLQSTQLGNGAQETQMEGFVQANMCQGSKT